MATEEVTKTTSTEINDSGESVQRQSTSVDRSADAQSTAANVVWYIFGVIAFLLGIRFVLKLLGANSANGFVDFVYAVSGVLSAPFDNIFNVQSTEAGSTTSVFEPSILIAILVYGLIAWGIAKAISINKR